MQPGVYVLCSRWECEKRLRQEQEDRNEQLVDKLNFETRMHDQVRDSNLQQFIKNTTSTWLTDPFSELVAKLVNLVAS